MNADGSARTDLTNTTGANYNDVDPAFSPDGRLIAYSDDPPPSDGSFDEIRTLNSLDGSGRTDLTRTPPENAEDQPAWESVYTCAGRRATIVGSDSGEKLKGTKKADVIVGNGGKDKVFGRGGNDRICGGPGKDKLIGGGGKDRCIGGKGRDTGRCEKGKL